MKHANRADIPHPFNKKVDLSSKTRPEHETGFLTKVDLIVGKGEGYHLEIKRLFFPM